MSGDALSKILLLVDAGPGSKSAAEVAALLAGATRASVTALSVADAGTSRSATEATLAEAASALGRAGVSVETALLGEETAVVDEVVRRAKGGYDLTVLGAPSRPAPGGGRLSLRLWQLARSVPTPVLLVPQGAPLEMKRILLCTGGELYIEEGLRFTAALASALGAAITVLHVLPEPPELYRDLAARYSSPSGYLAGESRLARQLRAQMAALEKRSVPASLAVEEGDVENTIFEVANRVEAQLIVVGSSPARGPLRSSILGNVTREVASRSAAPVLIVRSRPAGLLRDLWRILREG